MNTADSNKVIARLQATVGALNTQIAIKDVIIEELLEQQGKPDPVEGEVIEGETEEAE